MVRCLGVGLVLGLALGCGESSELDPDAGIVFDASRPDVQPEMDAPPPRTVGEACRGAGDCGEGEMCIGEFPGGYCTMACGTCPDASTCVQFGGGSAFCLADCDPRAERPCRAGYGCTTDPRIGNVCIPGCTDDSDCASGTICDPNGGSAGEGSCHDPDARYGDACMQDEQCPVATFCFGESFGGWPNGACIGFGCDPDTNTGCGEGGTCVPSTGGDGLCVASCTGEGDCRDGYSCVEGSDGRRSCLPSCSTNADCTGGRVCNAALGTCNVPFDDSQLGAACTFRRSSCRGGTCLTEFESGFPGAHCAYYGCDVNAADDASDGCPTNGVCADIGADGVCLLRCDADEDCTRSGYRCRDVDASNPARGRGCFPACEGDEVCANDGSGGAPRFECNEGTGLCTYPFDPTRLGASCGSADECAGGRCLTDGWPGGTCAALGCRVAGEGAEQPCPEGGVCVADGAGELGICLVGCALEASGTCREGYACVAAAEGSTVGVCRPATPDEPGEPGEPAEPGDEG
ncbi:MAG: hypothetical protein KF901_21970 [Myxococcales bacterium]|nr:hypothetical protein [Myxococcales bacterium]